MVGGPATSSRFLACLFELCVVACVDLIVGQSVIVV